jgi:DNA primase
MLPKNFPDDVRNQADIVRIVSDYVALKKRGANWIACCPFHSEKTPSFNVHPGKGIYKCFGCSAGGNVFDFVMRVEGLSFPDAVRLVAEKSGIPVPRDVAPQPGAERADRRRKRLFELNEWACEFFEQQFGATAEGRRALEYVEGRGVTSVTRERFRLGYAPNSWDTLSSHLASRGASREEIADSGLVTVKESGGGYYDRFRGRVIFPISDAQGRPVAFGGRTMGDDKPKYLNSPETAVYTKGNHLYGLFQAREAIRKAGFAVLVEGYLDVLLPSQEGVENVVASLGTALTEAQARLLRRYMARPQVIVNYDPDTAGQAATTRSFETLLAQGFKINVLSLPGGLDPDEFVREHGAQAYRDLMRTTVAYIDYVVDRAMERNDLTRPSGKADALNEVLPFVAQIENQLERVEYGRRIASRMHIDEDVFRKELRRAVERREPKIDRDRVAPPADLTQLERYFLVVLFGDEQVRSSILPEIEIADIEGLASEPIFRALLDAHRSGESIGYAEISDKLSDSARQNLAGLVAIDVSEVTASWSLAGNESLADAARRTCLARLRRTRLQKELEQITRQIRQAESGGDEACLPDLYKRKMELGVELARLSAQPR